MLMDPHPTQQHAGLQHAVWQLQQEVTRPNAKFKSSSPEKSGVDGWPISCHHILVSFFNWWSGLAIITFKNWTSLATVQLFKFWRSQFPVSSHEMSISAICRFEKNKFWKILFYIFHFLTEAHKSFSSINILNGCKRTFSANKTWPFEKWTCNQREQMLK